MEYVIKIFDHLDGANLIAIGVMFGVGCLFLCKRLDKIAKDYENRGYGTKHD